MITTHVLDAVTGRPASGLDVALERLGTSGWEAVSSGCTDQDGRLRSLTPGDVPAGTYRLTFATGAWFSAAGRETFYPDVTVTFRVTAGADGATGHHHVPLLLSPFAYSTYRGS